MAHDFRGLRPRGLPVPTTPVLLPTFFSPRIARVAPARNMSIPFRSRALAGLSARAFLLVYTEYKSKCYALHMSTRGNSSEQMHPLVSLGNDAHLALRDR